MRGSVVIIAAVIVALGLALSGGRWERWEVVGHHKLLGGYGVLSLDKWTGKVCIRELIAVEPAVKCF